MNSRISVTPLRIVETAGGNIFHALKSSGSSYKGFGEAYFSAIDQHRIKGWKRHNRLDLNIVVPVGEIKFVIIDDDAPEQSERKFQEVVLGPVVNYALLSIPAGLWVAFQGLSESNLLMNIIAEEHDPLESDNRELGDFDYSWVRP